MTWPNYIQRAFWCSIYFYKCIVNERIAKNVKPLNSQSVANDCSIAWRARASNRTSWPDQQEKEKQLSNGAKWVLIWTNEGEKKKTQAKYVLTRNWLICTKCTWYTIFISIYTCPMLNALDYATLVLGICICRIQIIVINNIMFISYMCI